MLEMLHYFWSTVEFIVGIVNYVVNIFNICLSVNILVGKIIADIVSKCFNGIYDCLLFTINGVTIMCEDFSYFIIDLENIFSLTVSCFQFMVESVFNLIFTIFICVINTAFALLEFIVCIKESICGIYRNGIKLIYDFIIMFKAALILIGNVIWTCVKLIPGLFIYLISVFVFFINRSAEEALTLLFAIFDTIYSVCCEIYLFIIDTPFESVCGLLIALAFIYLSSKYKISIANNATSCYYKISRYLQKVSFSCLIIVLNGLHIFLLKLRFLFYNLKKIFNKHLRSNMIRSEHNVINEHSRENERLCVVCQDRESNVVIIPCKHMCLCEECSLNEAFRHYRYTTCPICRHHIDGLLKVYL
ncbi:uncharacterized protein LOC142329413 [Lycorma delicatula]|uniref:uncharacterized protein LOC142329413 n=1 Tax=Lycorma delicatula TaxID=130591 RepID=UPI003F516044